MQSGGGGGGGGEWPGDKATTFPIINILASKAIILSALPSSTTVTILPSATGPNLLHCRER